MNRNTVKGALGLGLLVGGAVVLIGLLRPAPNVVLVAATALAIGGVASLWTYRRAGGKVPLPDGVVLTLFAGMLVFWGWVAETGFRGTVIEGWVDVAAAAIVIAVPLGGIVLVVWNRFSTGRHLLDELARSSIVREGLSGGPGSGRGA